VVGAEVTLGPLGGRLIARDATIASEAAHVERREAVAACTASALAIEDAGDEGVGVVRGEPANEREAVFVSAHAWWVGRGQPVLEFGDSPAAPAYGEVSPGLGALDGNHDFLQQGAQQFFLVARGRRWGVPHPAECGE